MLKFSLRTLLLLVIPAAAVVAVAVREGKPRLVQTDDPSDLAITGRGYFCVTDESGDNPRYTRGGKLVVNQYNQLAFSIGKELVLLWPNITIPSDYLSVEINADGRVLVSTPGQKELLQQGQLELATFGSANLPILNEPLFAVTDELSSPTLSSPNEFGAGQTKQGYLEQRPLAWRRDSIMTLLIGFALGALAMAAVRFRRAT